MEAAPSGVSLLLGGSPSWAPSTDASWELFPSGGFLAKERHSSWISSGGFQSLTGSEQHRLMRTATCWDTGNRVRFWRAYLLHHLTQLLGERLLTDLYLIGVGARPAVALLFWFRF